MKQIPPTATTIVVRMAKTNYIDQSGLYAIEDSLTELIESDKTVLLVDLQPQVRYMLELIDIVPDLIPESHIFKNFDDCLAWIKQNVPNVV
jgi:SulP family sulfate permease